MKTSDLSESLAPICNLPYCSIFFPQQCGNNFDLNAYGHEDVDRFGVILDLWTNETAFLENKRKVSVLKSLLSQEKN